MWRSVFSASPASSSASASGSFCTACLATAAPGDAVLRGRLPPGHSLDALSNFHDLLDHFILVGMLAVFSRLGRVLYLATYLLNQYTFVILDGLFAAEGVGFRPARGAGWP